MKECCWILVWMCFILRNCVVFGSKTLSQSSNCGVYLAQSTIPHAGLGMYAGKDYLPKQQVTGGDIVIPIIEIEWHNGHEGECLVVSGVEHHRARAHHVIMCMLNTKSLIITATLRQLDIPVGRLCMESH